MQDIRNLNLFNVRVRSTNLTVSINFDFILKAKNESISIHFPVFSLLDRFLLAFWLVLRTKLMKNFLYVFFIINLKKRNSRWVNSMQIFDGLIKIHAYNTGTNRLISTKKKAYTWICKRAHITWKISIKNQLRKMGW